MAESELSKTFLNAGVSHERAKYYAKEFARKGVGLTKLLETDAGAFTKNYQSTITISNDLLRIGTYLETLKSKHHSRNISANDPSKRLSVADAGSPYSSPHGSRSPTNRPASPFVGFNKTRSGLSGSSSRPAQKRALLVGINYVNNESRFRLRGCHNDVLMAQEMLKNDYGFQDDFIHILMDDGKNTIPTRANIVRELEWLVRDPNDDDTFYFHYSGHGAQIPNRSGKHIDVAGGYEEILVPVDIEWDSKHKTWNNHVSSSDFDSLFKHLVQSEANFISVLDCCHSGTAFREVGSRGLFDGEPDIKPRFLPAPVDEELKIVPTRSFATERSDVARQEETTYPEYAVLLAAARSDQTAADANINGKACGAFSNYFYKLVKETHGRETYINMINVVKEVLSKSGFSQIPQLDSLKSKYNWVFMTEAAPTRNLESAFRDATPPVHLIDKLHQKNMVTRVDTSRSQASGANWAGIKAVPATEADSRLLNRDYDAKSRSQEEFDYCRDIVRASIRNYRTMVV